MKNFVLKTVAPFVLTLMISPLALAAQTRMINLGVITPTIYTLNNFSVTYLDHNPNNHLGGTMTHEPEVPVNRQYKDAFYINSTADNPFSGKLSITATIEKAGLPIENLTSVFSVASNGRLSDTSGALATNSAIQTKGNQPACMIDVNPGFGILHDTINVFCLT